MNRTATCIWGFLLLLLPALVLAEQSESFGDYTAHYSAFTTDLLTPEVAKSYRIARSKNRAMLNVSVLKKVMGTTAQPVKASVKVTAANLNSQLRELQMREINEQGAIYYIAETPVSNGETLKFTITVEPEGETAGHTFSFQQQFFTD